MIQKTYDFSRTGPQPTQLVVRWEFWEKCSQVGSSPCDAISGGPRARSIWPPAIFSCGDTSRPRFTNIGLKPSKHLRPLFVRKLSPFPQRWPIYWWKTLENGFGSSSRITAATWVMLFSTPNGGKTRLYVLFENIKLFSVTCLVLFYYPLKYGSPFCRTLYLHYITWMVDEYGTFME